MGKERVCARERVHKRGRGRAQALGVRRQWRGGGTHTGEGEGALEREGVREREGESVGSGCVQAAEREGGERGPWA